jgi:dipeptidase E
MEDDSMGKLVLIGGVTPPSSLDLIDEEIIRLTKKKNPKILYVPTAGEDDLYYCNFFRGIYEGRFGCKFDILFLVRETPTEHEIREKVFSSDIIYIEGGDVSRLMDYFKKYNIDKILEEAYKKEIVLTGKSAGALCWGRCYFISDDAKDFKSKGFNDYKDIDCLNFINFIVCPHYNLEDYSEKMEAMINVHGGVGIALENNCTLEIIDDNYRIIATQDDADAYKVYQKETKIISEVIIKDNDFRNIDELRNVK